MSDSRYFLPGPVRVSRRRLAKAIGAVCALVLLPGVAVADGYRNSGVGVPGVRGGVVTTSEPVAAKVGAQVLREGGNAIDAAAAIQFALNVVEPQSSGIGGGGFMMIHLRRAGVTFVIDSRERTPEAGSPEMFLMASDPSAAFSFGIRSTSGVGVGVPGTVRGVEAALKGWGTISFAESLRPAIELAEKGIRVSSRLAESVTSSRLANEIGSAAYDEARMVFVPDGAPLEENDLLVQPDLARTLRLLADNGPDAFYTGELARAIIHTQQNARTVDDPADARKLQGLMTLDDLAAYRVAYRRPVVGSYRGLKIVSMPPPSSGGLTTIQILKLMERFPVADERRGFGFGSARTLNVMIESMRLAFQDRSVWMGDDDFVDVPSRGLLNRRYIAMRSALINPDARQAEVAPDDPRPFDGGGKKRSIRRSGLADDEGLNTTHFTVTDRHGNIVTYTSTIESAWGTGLMVPGYGFLLNNELTDFNSSPTANDDEDAFNPGANDAAPFKRPRSSMAPTMIFRGRTPIAAYGSPGGSSIINTVVNITMNLIDHELPVQEAVDAPRISFSSSSTTGGTTLFEQGFDDDVIEALTELGHAFFPFEIGSVQAIVRDPRTGRQFGAADKRRIGSTISVRRKEIARH